MKINRKQGRKSGFFDKVKQIDTSKGNWWEYHLKGIISIAFGILLIAWPEESLRFLVIIMGIQALLKGGIGLVHTIALARKQDKWGPVLLESLAGLILGMVIITWPEASLKTAAVLIGIWMITTGLGQPIIAEPGSSKIGKGLLGAGGLFSVIIGILLVTLPMETVALAHTLSAIQALVLGSIFIIVGSYMLLRSHKYGSKDTSIQAPDTADKVQK